MRERLLLGVAFAAPLTIAAVSWIATGKNVVAIVVGISCLALSAVAIWVSMRSVRSTNDVTLTAERFEVVRGSSFESYDWRDVTNFRVVSQEEGTRVVFDLVNSRKRHGRLSKLVGNDHDVTLPITYELSEGDLAYVMDAWRRRVLKPSWPGVRLLLPQLGRRWPTYVRMMRRIRRVRLRPSAELWS
jgi:hypothetical protein